LRAENSANPSHQSGETKDRSLTRTDLWPTNAFSAPPKTRLVRSEENQTTGARRYSSLPAD